MRRPLGNWQQSASGQESQDDDGSPKIWLGHWVEQDKRRGQPRNNSRSNTEYIHRCPVPRRLRRCQARTTQRRRHHSREQVLGLKFEPKIMGGNEGVEDSKTLYRLHPRGIRSQPGRLQHFIRCHIVSHIKYTVIPTPSRALTLSEEKRQREPTRKNTPCEARDGISKASEALVLFSTAGKRSGD
ncbi:hypothetical protein I7I48_06587 [Histoplasma ohiense]|nr:hypothetical protein I7I48_06587 [Histoplasma ohiense (nom. inval.)]